VVASSLEQLVASVRRGETRAAARACRIVDEAWPGHLELLAALYPYARASWYIGITGSPGVGKSTLTSRLVQHFRAGRQRVGVVAVDPTSPFSGGAILGDRIRMQAHWADSGVFIRSVATRGALGGLSRSAADIARVLAAWGAEVVLIETVGVGQDELDIMRVAHTTLVVQAPGAGDDVQAAKAGLLECADVFAVNKADLPGAETTVQHLRSMLALGQVVAPSTFPRHGHAATTRGASGASAAAASEGASPVAPLEWEVPVTSCVAASDAGVVEVIEQLKRHLSWLRDTPLGQARHARRLRDELAALIREALSSAVFERYAADIERAAEQVAADHTDPYSASRALVRRWVEGA
jgi:LAO/AO transport system kinase